MEFLRTKSENLASDFERNVSLPTLDLGSQRALICISHYGTTNVPFLLRMLAGWDQVPFGTIDVVLFCTHPPELPPFSRLRIRIQQYPVEIRKLLTYQHRAFMASQQGNYDLYVYTEDDILITETNIQAFLRLSSALPAPYIPGFLVYEQLDATREKSYVATWILGHHYPPVRKLVQINGMTFARMGNEHQCCYLLTSTQFDRILNTHRSDYLCPPRAIPPYVSWRHICGGFGPMESAASGVYVECGLTRVCWMDDLAAISIRHLPNRYLVLMKDEIARHELMSPGDFQEPALARWRHFAPTWRNLYWWCRYGAMGLLVRTLCRLGIPADRAKPR